jgi:hypothetical protein
MCFFGKQHSDRLHGFLNLPGTIRNFIFKREMISELGIYTHETITEG